MKLQELRQIIREVISEELANDSYNKKAKAINEIKRIIAENELTEEEIEEALPSFLQKGLQTVSSKLTKGTDITSYKFKNPAKKPSTELINVIKNVNSNLSDEEALKIAQVVIDMGEAASVVNGNKNVIANPKIDKNTNPNYIKIIGAIATMNPNPVG